uniref:Retrovirus-related Pol polyprotein from transposon TNT 1-94 n=1 Tax=Tanacetum cinerariifolium TaxID=118510 RepID=A0A699IYR6_TANCI|nr:retrovirus-related Pol polyprotein from transposon TNT 1-94 [Tanacetum cinerariifolium]
MRLIQSLASKELVRNLPRLKFDQQFCDACKIRNQAHSSHRAKNIVSTTRCLELLHMDLFGPSVVRSYGGNRYTLVIFDDYSSIIQKTNAIVIRDSEETLMPEEESRSKMLQKQKDPMMSEKKVNTKPVDYAALNQLSQDFKTRFVPQTELPTQVEVPKELSKVSMVNSSLKKLKFHLASFDVVVKERSTATAITEST